MPLPLIAPRALSRSCANCESLGEFPRAYPLVPRYEDSGVRRRVHGNYLIFYRIGVDTIDVLHLLHGAMEYAPLLFPDG